MASPTDLAPQEPSWAEIVIGVALSFVIGVVLAAVLLVVKPVETVKELPEEPAHDVVYYVEGSRDATKGKIWARKRQMFVAGQSISLGDDELNAIIAPTATPMPPAQPAGKDGKAPEPLAAPSGMSVGTPNFHLVNEELQIAVPCTLSVMGVSRPVMVMATGGFRKEDDIIAFAPRKYYLGSLDITRLPGVTAIVTDKLLAGQAIPADIVEAWTKLSDVTVEPKALRLTMP